MADINQELGQINNALYGKDVRNAIYKGLQAINEEVNQTNQVISDTKILLSNSQNLLNNGNNIANKIANIGQTVNELKAIQDSSNKNLIASSNFTGEAKGNALMSRAFGFGNTTTTNKVIKGKTYTFSVCGYVEEKALNEGGQLKVFVYNQDWSEHICTLVIDKTSATIQSDTFTATKTEYLHILSYLSPQSSSYTGSAGVSWYSLTEGTTQTKEWTPCPDSLNGGVNLFGGSNFGSNGINLSTNGGLWNTTEVELQSGESYTFTACATSDSNTSNSGALCSIYTNDGVETHNLFFAPGSTNYQSVTFIAQNDAKFTFGFFSGDLNKNNYGVTCNLKWYSLVRGTTPKAWTPSMGDINGKTSLQLAALGKQTTQVLLAQNMARKESQSLGLTATELMLENNKLKDQVKVLAQQIIKMQLNKK